jgi:hypothetical protein
MRDTQVCSGARWALRELVRRPARSAGVVAGFALVTGVSILLLALAAGARDDAARILSVTGTHFVAYAPYGAAGASCADCAPAPDAAEGFVADTVWTGLLPLSALEQARALPSVRDASPCLLYRIGGQGADALTIGGFDTAAPVAVRTTTCAPADVVEGRFLGSGERGAVLAEQGAAIARSWRVGEVVRVAGVRLMIAGIVNTGIRPVKADLYSGLEDATTIVQSRLGSPLAGRFNVLLLEARSAEVHERAMAEVRELLGSAAVLSTYACYRPAVEALDIDERGLTALIAVTSLLVLALAWQSRHASVLERRRDLGILRAVGWTDGEILGQLLAESLILALAGWAAGSLAATGAVGVAALAGAEPRLAIGPYFLALTGALVGGTLAGLGPAVATLRRSVMELIRAL